MLGRPKGTYKKKPGKVTSVHLNNETKEYIESKGLSLTGAVNLIPLWHRRMEEIAEELSDLRKGNEKKDKTIRDLYKEITDLQNFKRKVLTKWAQEKEANGIKN